MAKQFKNVSGLIKNLSENEDFKKDAIEQISENSLGKFLSFLRCDHKLTQKGLAEKIGCTQGRISKIESAKDENLSIKDFIEYGNSLGLELEIGYRSKKMRWIDMVKYHAFKMQKYLNLMVEVAKEDEAMETGVLDFHVETLRNVPRMILDSMAKIKKLQFNKYVKSPKEKIHISGPIQPCVKAKKEKVSL